MSSIPSGTKILSALALLGGSFALAYAFRVDGTAARESPREPIDPLVLRETPAPSEAYVVRPDAPTAEIQPTLLSPPMAEPEAPETTEQQFARLAPPPMMARLYPSASPFPRYGGQQFGADRRDSSSGDWQRLHKVRDGDTLEALAERYLDDRGRWREIFEANRDLVARPDLLPLGTRLKIPQKYPLPESPAADDPLPVQRAPLVRVAP